MTYSEFMETEYYSNLLSDYANELPSTHWLWYWIKDRFYNYVCLYPDEYQFYRLMKIAIWDCELHIKKISYLKDVEMSNFGTTTNTENDTTQVSDGNLTNSYSGYNVEGDFNKQNSSGTSTGNSKGKVMVTDNFALLNQELTFLYDAIFEKFSHLFILVSV